MPSLVNTADISSETVCSSLPRRPATAALSRPFAASRAAVSSRAVRVLRSPAGSGRGRRPAAASCPRARAASVGAAGGGGLHAAVELLRGPVEVAGGAQRRAVVDQRVRQLVRGGRLLQAADGLGEQRERAGRSGDRRGDPQGLADRAGRAEHAGPGDGLVGVAPGLLGPVPGQGEGEVQLPGAPGGVGGAALPEPVACRRQLLDGLVGPAAGQQEFAPDGLRVGETTVLGGSSPNR